MAGPDIPAPRTRAARARARQVTAYLLFAASVMAIAATSPVSSPVRVAPASERLRLDAEHPVALARIVIVVTPESTSANPYFEFRLAINQVTPVGGGSPIPFRDNAVRFIAMSAVPGAVPGLPTNDPGAQPAPSGWQQELERGSGVSLPMSCGTGPCERAFWLVAQLADVNVGAVDVAYGVEGTIRYPSDTWPSGAGASITVDPPITVDGPIPQLVVQTEPEDIVLGPTHPAAARLVEVRIGPDAITGGTDPIAVMSVDIGRYGGNGYERRPIVRVYPLLGFDGSATLPVPSAVPDGVDPFAGCDPGVECVRRFLVTFAWNGIDGEDERDAWSLSVRRADLIHAWTAPSEIKVGIVRKIDVDPASASKVIHLEGDEQTVHSIDDPQVYVGLGGTTTAGDPIAGLLPVPAVMTLRVNVVRSDPAATPDRRDFANVDWRGEYLAGQAHLTLFENDDTIMANPLAGCRLDDGCDDLALRIVRQGPLDKDPLPSVAAHWSLDITSYSYVDIPVELTVLQR